jgi:two-component system alkaline phosphatase synthesis response regulator PhoP
MTISPNHSIWKKFLLRVRVLLRHSIKGTKDEDSLKTYQFGGNYINFITYKAIGQAGDIDLTKKEAKLLKLLIERADEVISREQNFAICLGLRRISVYAYYR